MKHSKWTINKDKNGPWSEKSDRIKRTMILIFKALGEQPGIKIKGHIRVPADEAISAMINVLCHLISGLPAEFRDELVLSLTTAVSQAVQQVIDDPSQQIITSEMGDDVEGYDELEDILKTTQH